MDKGYYRLVPYRFFLDEKADRCKLEKLINLFPEMKSVIELEFFKSNHLSRMIERLSRVYPLLSALDVRDDTMHVFLGPYHLCLGPAMAGAYRFKYLSNLLLASSTSKQRSRGRARRSEFVLRRFRRLVRKLIMIKSILHQLRLTSILTPYNQYELINNGIYDLVLAGHQSDASNIFNETSFVEEIENLRPLNHPDEKSFLLATNFIKMNTLLQLLSSTANSSNNDDLHRSISMPTSSTPIQSITTNETKENETNNLIESTNLCCSQHNPYTPMIVFPLKSFVSEQTTQIIPKKCRSRVNSAHASSNRSSFILSRQNTTTSQSESVNSDANSTHDEDRLVDQIASIVSNYLLSQRQNSNVIDDVSNLIDRIKTNVQENLIGKSANSSYLSVDERRKTFSMRTKSFHDDSSRRERRMFSGKSQSLDINE